MVRDIAKKELVAWTDQGMDFPLVVSFMKINEQNIAISLYRQSKETCLCASSRTPFFSKDLQKITTLTELLQMYFQELPSQGNPHVCPSAK